MNAPFKPPSINEVHGRPTVGISTLKANPAAVVATASDQPVAILSRNKAVAYMVSPDFIERALDAFEELEDIEVVRERLANPAERIAVSIEDLA